MTNFKQTLKENHGWIHSNEIDLAIQDLGKDFPVVLKTYTNGRPFVSLQELKELPETNHSLYSDIREVFISSYHYDEMFGESNS